ncbi:MAG: LysE family transporter [Pseudomonadota bacterium]
MSLWLTLLGVFAVFIPALMLPGPDFVAVVRSTMARGTRAGLLTTVGVSIGLFFYASLSMLGLSAILIEYQWLATTVRILGGAYLIFLGVRLLRAKRADFHVGSDEPPSRRRAILFGLSVTLTNPKAVVLFASVFATAMTPTTPIWFMLVLIGLVTTSALVWYTLVTLFIASPPVVRRLGDTKHWVERVAGGSFVLIGLSVMARSRAPVSP